MTNHFWVRHWRQCIAACLQRIDSGNPWPVSIYIGCSSSWPCESSLHPCSTLVLPLPRLLFSLLCILSCAAIAQIPCVQYSDIKDSLPRPPPKKAPVVTETAPYSTHWGNTARWGTCGHSGRACRQEQAGCLQQQHA